MLITLFKDTPNETTYDLTKDLQLVDIDELDDDLLVTVDLCGITLEYISTNEGLSLEDCYVVDGGYCFLPKMDFNIPDIKNTVENLIIDNIH